MDEEPETETTETESNAETTVAETESHAETTVTETESHPETTVADTETTAAETEGTAAETETSAHEAGSAASIGSRTSINLGTPPESKHSNEEDAPVIDLEGGGIEEFPKETAVFDESETPTPKVAEDEEAPPEGEAAAVGEEGEKAVVVVRPSHDETDQIQAQEPPAEEINLDTVRKSIIDPELVQQAENIFGQPRSPLGPVISISSSSEEEEEEEESLSDICSYLAELGLKSGKEPIDRAQYEEEFHSLREVSLKLRRKNGLLNKKISEYYRKRKLTRVFEETNVDLYETLIDKYEEKIADYEDLQTKTCREKEAVDNEMTDMMNLRDEQLAELKSSFAAMQAREQEVGHGLIDTNTGKVISDKVVERLLFRQKVKSEEIAKIRLAFIKRRDKVKQIDNKIKALETIGGTLHLMDFEQLRMENQTFSDKIEERDEELMRLRDRYSHAMQALAHIREKINIIEVQIDDLQDKKINEDANVSKSREFLNQLKIQRDLNRSQKDKLKLNTGILTYSKLLLDMEIGIKEIEELRNQLEEFKAMNHENREKLFHIRNLMDKTEHVQNKRSQRKIKSKQTIKGAPRYYVNRPTITYPVLPKIAQLKARLDRMKIDENR